MEIPRSYSEDERYFRKKKSCRRKQTHFMFNNFSNNRNDYMIMWKNTVDLDFDTDDNTIWCVLFAC